MSDDGPFQHSIMRGYQKVLELSIPPDDMLVRLTGPMAEGLAHCGWAVVDQNAGGVIYSRKRDRRGLAILVGVFALFARGGEDRLTVSVTPTNDGCRVIFAGDVDAKTQKLLAYLDA